MKYLDVNEGLKIYDMRFDVTTAGPSPNGNKRIELFLLGCDKAMNGCPCKGCFNQPLWNANKAEHSLDPIEVANWIIQRTPSNEKYISLGGGEPLAQIDKLIPLCKVLKENGFHIMMYTWRKLSYYLEEKDITQDLTIAPFSNYIRQRLPELLPYIDMIVDGQYDEKERLYDSSKEDGLLSSIGSGNQKIWDINFYNKTGKYRAYYMRDIQQLKMDKEHLIFYLKEGYKPC